MLLVVVCSPLSPPPFSFFIVVVFAIDCTLPGCYSSLMYLAGRWGTVIHSRCHPRRCEDLCAASGLITWEVRNAEGIPPFPTYTLNALILHTDAAGCSPWMPGTPDICRSSMQSDMKHTVTFWCLPSCMEQSSWEAICCSAYQEIFLFWYNLKVHLHICNCWAT
jgi:hypothetical protein